ncbi:hypothetical protein KPH14_009966 [Odynerus spinipes]|uniref:MICOS complex subunit MIC19 n=1 Tax=Odynerus spinipes TaxID=1348599 RepID=A0AAD9VSG0_9HYME|nr:hypothetical protein KPH14_009966 [Odynerus spinipes]
MGSEQSTRKLTIFNEEEIGVIKVSNAVVQRLAQGSNEISKEATKDRQKEQELQAQNQYWQRRLQNMEKKHLMIDHILEEEYKKALNEFSSIGKGPKSGDNLGNEQPCITGKEKVLKCYQDHPKEILKCSNLVEEFSNCVDQRRVNFIATRC